MNEFPPTKYVFTMVTSEALTQEEQMDLFEALAKTKKSLTLKFLQFGFDIEHLRIKKEPIGLKQK